VNPYIKREFHKRIKFGINHSVKISTYYLSEFDSGIRVEVRRDSLSKTVEIFLLIGDDKVILKREIDKLVLQNPTKRQIEKMVMKFINESFQNKYL
jgi:hypothetical protein